MTWKPVQLGDEPKIERHPTYGARLRVTIPLVPAPDDAWRDYFNQKFMPNISISLSRSIPSCNYSGIVMEPPDREDEMADYYVDVRDRLGATNQWYETVYLPASERAAAQQRAAAEKEKERLAVAKLNLKKIMKP